MRSSTDDATADEGRAAATTRSARRYVVAVGAVMVTGFAAGVGVARAVGADGPILGVVLPALVGTVVALVAVARGLARPEAADDLARRRRRLPWLLPLGFVWCACGGALVQALMTYFDEHDEPPPSWASGLGIGGFVLMAVALVLLVRMMRGRPRGQQPAARELLPVLSLELLGLAAILIAALE